MMVIVMVLAVAVMILIMAATVATFSPKAFEYVF
jgi:hypothetical protein